MEKALVLFSGGIDSTICLALAIKKYGIKNVVALSINYGQRNEKELEAAKSIAKFYKVNHEIINISNLFKYSNSSMLKSSSKEIPKETYSKQLKKINENERVSTNVPFRNGLMLSICASYALENGYSVIYYGIHREDGVAYSLYPDCSFEFNYYMNLAIEAGTGNDVSIYAPLVNYGKSEIIKIGLDENVPFELTWTCYISDDFPCGECTACLDRIKAFKENNINDKLIYKK